MGVVVDITGNKYGRLFVLNMSRIFKHKAMWLCICDCENTVEVSGSDLRSGHTRSCGCYHKDIVTKHGLRSTKLNSVRSAMIDRCYNIKNSNYYNYGGRGIKVCDEWLNKEKGLLDFYNWAMDNGYKEGVSIDRINNNGNYCSENCRWVDMKTQLNNRRNNRLVTIGGETKTVSQWAEVAGIGTSTIDFRLRSGKSGEDLIKSSSRDKTKSGVKGVTWEAKSNKWIARVQFNGARQYLGLYETVNEASLAIQDYLSNTTGRW
ncbi:hypothetical protein HFE03_08050 [Paenibacillus sp. EKM102P]|uniref:hypothetical protein n=1 Tax=unclassified Paenibacillus TaxID=185978 RepID=UPI00142D681E|nr:MULTISPECIES: hypothetical protein [unclassified Paenibacillus]KAF6620594.1 hypothetical protein HFE00_05950 [Paenibacillus sp. EKM101P]KAF6623587.1 hypothetical protein HFE03_08050 [Paenibacillus sp. EKM102P]KAF6633852.1 hypothetical protein HFE01_06465 [Paenibacillus sp. EKM10P]KAF6649377.1 hypothetical protein HFE02_01420 [Paenibacillus sp. EKM11P]